MNVPGKFARTSQLCRYDSILWRPSENSHVNLMRQFVALEHYMQFLPSKRSKTLLQLNLAHSIPVGGQSSASIAPRFSLNCPVAQSSLDLFKTSRTSRFSRRLSLTFKTSVRYNTDLLHIRDAVGAFETHCSFLFDEELP